MKKIYAAIALSVAVLLVLPLWADNDTKQKKDVFFPNHEFAAPGTNFIIPVSNRSIEKTSLLTKKRVNAEEGKSFSEGKVIISAGYGWPNLGKSVLNALISDSAINVKATGLGPLHFRAEYALSDGVGLGVSVNYISCGLRYNESIYEYNLTRSSLSILARINFHFGTTGQLDPYFGVGAGYRQATWKWTSNDPNFVEGSFPGFTPFGFETTVGIRYYFVEGFGMYTEIGIAKSVIQAGLVFAF